MKVFAVDPGNTHSAWVIWDGTRVIEHGYQPNVDVLDELDERGAIGTDLVVAIEMIQSFGMAVGTEVFETCVWIGRLMQTWIERTDDEPLRLSRMTVKHHLCHSSQAKDTNIRQALIDRVGAPGVKKAPGPTYGLHGDEWSALAVAVTAWDQLVEQRAERTA